MTRALHATMMALLVSGLAGAGLAEQRAVRQILTKFDSVRPQARELALFRLDWVPTLAEAKQRAAREGRPILLLVVHNSAGDLRGGHC